MGTATASRTWKNKRTWTIAGAGIPTAEDITTITHGFLGITAADSQLVATGRYTTSVGYGARPIGITLGATTATVRAEGGANSVVMIEKVHTSGG